MKPELQALIHNTTREAFALVLADKSASAAGYGHDCGLVSEGRDVFREGHAKYRARVDVVGDRLVVGFFADYPLADADRKLVECAEKLAKARKQREEVEIERQNLLDKLAAVDAKIKELENTPNE